ncbi:MAG: hypothetical protein MUF15_28605 [Acidobacteria bacterium]|nr:hypothetical protein [Acidobacteriota bacterium]
MRKARINLNTEDEEKKGTKETDSKIYWVEKEKQLVVIELPVMYKKINIWWKTIPKESMGFTIDYSQGKHKSKIQLYFPNGISEGGKK